MLPFFFMRTASSTWINGEWKKQDIVSSIHVCVKLGLSFVKESILIAITITSFQARPSSVEPGVGQRRDDAHAP